ncbi:MAG: serine hydrolase [Candidatus Margulisbacteria bacterium]|nr:serine hydrolase [Candidatus Margulisiibacteriota bacterium]
MKNSALLLGLAAMLGLFLLAGNSWGQTLNHSHQTALASLLSSKWESYAAGKTNFGGGLAMYIISPKGDFYASANMPGGTKDAHFRGASTTKSYTSAAIMLLHQQGKLNINDLITANIPGSSEPYVPATSDYNIPNKNEITIKLLLNHRAGVWDVANSDIPSKETVPYAGKNYIDYIKELAPEHTFTFDELVGVVATCEISYFAPDTDYHYSDTGYSMLGKIVERVSGQRFDQFIAANLLTPNGLTETSFPYLGNDRTIPSPYETGYQYLSNTLTDVTVDNMSGHVAEGNVITTPADLAKWVRALITGQSGLTAATVSLMTTEATVRNYGLGIFKVTGLGFGHNGAHNGYLTTAFCDPAQDVTVVMSATVINWGDLGSEIKFLYDTSRAAKNLLGYSTAEAN